MKAVVTGGAGFIGSHVVDRLIKDGHEVTIIDNLSTGKISNIVHQLRENTHERFWITDLSDLSRLKVEMFGADIVFHFAANADIRGGPKNNYRDIEQNLLHTYNVLEAMRTLNIKNIVFASSAAIYGDPLTIPTPEHIRPHQTSLYGASKASAEALIEAFCEAYGMRAWIYRLVSTVGERYWHGVVYDFYKKLKANPHKLEILGDGKQRKSYLDVSDVVEGIFIGLNVPHHHVVNTFNIGHDQNCTVDYIASMVANEMNIGGIVSYDYTGGEIGWVGDSPVVVLDTERLRKKGWNPQVNIEDAIRNTVKYLIRSDKNGQKEKGRGTI